MNKELIKKYKNEFDHWLNGGSVLSINCIDTIDWREVDEFHWRCNKIHDYEPMFIINDGYVKLRKALAEGKTVQYNFGNFGPNKTDFPNIWKDLDLSIGILSDRALPENYRIKPESELKVGDWLYDLKYRTYHRIENVLEDKIETNTFKVYKSSINGVDYSIWEPKPDEWCIEEQPESINHFYFTVMKWQSDAIWTPAPYTGPIPHFIKEN